MRWLTPLPLFALIACGDVSPGDGDAAATADAATSDAPVAADAAPVTPDAGPQPFGAVDILFVIDDSGTMAEEQAALSDFFPAFLASLESAAGGLPDLHVGVVSTNLGAGPFNISSCPNTGDNGVLQSAPRGNCSPPTGAFIRDYYVDGTTRDTNYTGTLADTFACISQLGIDGCGFEQPLESMRRALDGSNPGNAGFLRAGADLAVVIITDEDDCSAADTNLFDTSQSTINDPLGPLSSFRCFEFGVTCSPDAPRTPGAKSNCQSRENSPFLFSVADYVSFLNGLEPAADDVFLAVVAAPNLPFEVSINTETGYPQVDPSCVSASGEGTPAVRLKQLADGVSGSMVRSICGDFAQTMSDIGAAIATHLP